jgi:hypothetical protein
MRNKKRRQERIELLLLNTYETWVQKRKRELVSSFTQSSFLSLSLPLPLVFVEEYKLKLFINIQKQKEKKKKERWGIVGQHIYIYTKHWPVQTHVVTTIHFYSLKTSQMPPSNNFYLALLGAKSKIFMESKNE